MLVGMTGFLNVTTGEKIIGLLLIEVFARPFNTYEIGFQIPDYQSEKNHEPSDCDTAYSPNNSWFAVQHIRSFPGKIR